MTKTQKAIVAIVIVAVLVVGFILGSLGANQADRVAAVRYDRLDQVGDFTQGMSQSILMSNGTLRLGSEGTALSNVVTGTCTLSTTVANLPLATSSKPFDCPATGVESGDQVFVSLPSNGGSLGGTPGVIMTHAKASTTADYIQVWLAIPFGAHSSVATSSFPLATTSVQYLSVRP